MPIEKVSIEQLGQKAKAKGDYKDLEDIKAGQAILDEYPEYWAHIADEYKPNPDKLLSLEEFGKKVREKSPEYKDDLTAAQDVLAKYPIYWKSVVEKKKDIGGPGSGIPYEDALPTPAQRQLVNNPFAKVGGEFTGTKPVEREKVTWDPNPGAAGGIPGASSMPLQLKRESEQKLKEETDAYFQSDEYKDHVKEIQRHADPILAKYQQNLDKKLLPSGRAMTYEEPEKKSFLGLTVNDLTKEQLKEKKDKEYSYQFVDMVMDLDPEMKGLTPERRYEIRMYLNNKVQANEHEKEFNALVRKTAKASGIELNDKLQPTILNTIQEKIKEYNTKMGELNTVVDDAANELQKKQYADQRVISDQLKILQKQLEEAITAGGITPDQANEQFNAAYKEQLDNLNRRIREQNINFTQTYQRLYDEKSKGMLDEIKKLKVKAKNAGLDFDPSTGKLDAESFYNRLISRAQVLQGSISDVKNLRNWNNTSFEDKTRIVLSSGVGDMIQTLAGGYLANQYYQTGEALRRKAEKLQFDQIPDTGEFSAKSLLDPMWWQTKGLRMLPFTLSLMGPSIGIGIGVKAAAAALGASAGITNVAGAVGATMVSRPLESLMEGGGAYLDVLNKGGSVAEAEKEFAYVNSRNYALAASDFIQFLPIFGKAIKGWERAAAVTVGSVLEGGEEIYQEWLTRRAGDRDYQLLEFMDSPAGREVFTLGAVNGLAFEYLGTAFKDNKEEKKAELVKKLMRQQLSSMVSTGEGVVNRKAQLANTLEVQMLNGIISKEDYESAVKSLDEVVSTLKVAPSTLDDSGRSQFLEAMSELKTINANLANATKETEEIYKQQKTDKLAQIKKIFDGTAEGYFIDNISYTKDEFTQLLNSPNFIALANTPGHLIEIRNDDQMTQAFNETMNKQTDTEIEDAQTRLGLPSEPTLILSDATQEKMDKLEKGEPMVNVSLKEVADELYDNYKRISRMKNSNVRQFSKQQLNEAADKLGKKITLINELMNSQAEEGKFISAQEVAQKLEEIDAVEEEKVQEEAKVEKKATEKAPAKVHTLSEKSVQSLDDLSNNKPVDIETAMSLYTDLQKQKQVNGDSKVVAENIDKTAKLLKGYGVTDKQLQELVPTVKKKEPTKVKKAEPVKEKLTTVKEKKAQIKKIDQQIEGNKKLSEVVPGLGGEAKVQSELEEQKAEAEKELAQAEEEHDAMLQEEEVPAVTEPSKPAPKVETRKQLTKTIKKAFGLSDDQAKFAGTVVDRMATARARRMGVTKESLFDKVTVVQKKYKERKNVELNQTKVKQEEDLDFKKNIESLLSQFKDQVDNRKEYPNVVEFVEKVLPKKYLEKYKFLYELAARVGVLVNPSENAYVPNTALAAFSGMFIELQPKVAFYGHRSWESFVKTVNHEVIHGILSKSINNNSYSLHADLDKVWTQVLQNMHRTKDDHVKAVIEAIREVTNDKRLNKVGFNSDNSVKTTPDLEELITYAFTDPVFAQFLDTIPSSSKTAAGEKQSIFERLKEIIRTFFEKLVDKTALDDLQEILDRYFDSSYAEADILNRNNKYGWNKNFELNQTRQHFYSTVERALAKITQNKGTVAQFKAMLLKNGAKQAELDWMGWDDFTKTEFAPITKIEAPAQDADKYGKYIYTFKDGTRVQAFTDAEAIQFYIDLGKKPERIERQFVTKQEIQQWINDNRIELKEVVKGTETTYFQGAMKAEPFTRHAALVRVRRDWDLLAMQALSENGLQGAEKERAEAYKAKYTSIAVLDDMIDEIEDNLDNYEVEEAITDTTQYSSYKTFGGENYKEWLLRLPKMVSRSNISAKFTGSQADNGTNMYWMYKDNVYEGIIFADSEEEAITKQLMFYGDTETTLFTSAHWGEPNVVVHMRTQEYVVGGKKVLLIDEIQSDWAQQGREHGFKDKYSGLLDKITQARKEAEKANNEERDYYTELYSRHGAAMDEEVDTGHSVYEEGYGVKEHETLEALKKATSETTRKYWDLMDQEDNGVNPTPFKQTSQWVNLGLRRMMQYASENGFDQVAWASGEMQAERYDLGGYVNSIEYSKNENGTYNIAGRNNDGDKVVSRNAVKSDDLSALVGKDLANKILNKEGERTGWYDAEVKNEDTMVRVFSGLDLQVGGEGQRGFYDQIVPTAVRNNIKTFGLELETIYVAGNRVQAFTISDQMRDTFSQAVPLFQQMFDDVQEAVAEEVPLASIRFTDDKAIITAFEGANITSLFHELGGHFTFEEILMGLNATDETIRARSAKELKVIVDAYNKNNPVVPVNSKDVFTDRDTYVAVHEFFANGFVNAMIHFGEQTIDSALMQLFKRFAKWVKDLFEGLKGEGLILTEELEALYRDVLDFSIEEEEEIASDLPEIDLEETLVDNQVPIKYAKDIARIAEYLSNQAADAVKWMSSHFYALLETYNPNFTLSSIANKEMRTLVNQIRYIIALKQDDNIFAPYMRAILDLSKAGNQSAINFIESAKQAFELSVKKESDIVQDSDVFLEFMLKAAFNAFEGMKLGNLKESFLNEATGANWADIQVPNDMTGIMEHFIAFAKGAVSLAQQAGVSLPEAKIKMLRDLGVSVTQPKSNVHKGMLPDAQKDEFGRLAVSVKTGTLGTKEDEEVFYYEDGEVYPMLTDPLNLMDQAKADKAVISKEKKHYVRIYTKDASFKANVPKLVYSLINKLGLEFQATDGKFGFYFDIKGDKVAVQKAMSVINSLYIDEITTYTKGDESITPLFTMLVREQGFKALQMGSDRLVMYEAPKSALTITGQTLFQKKPALTEAQIREVNQKLTSEMETTVKRFRAQRVNSKPLNKAGNLVFDRQFTIKRLLWAGSDQKTASKAVESINRVRRAGSIAGYQIQQAFDKVLGSLFSKENYILSKRERSLLSRLVNMLRVIELDTTYDKTGRARLTHTTIGIDDNVIMVNKEFAQGWIAMLKNKDEALLATYGLKPDQNINRIFKAADEFFKVMRNQLDQLYEHKIISENAYEKLKQEGQYYSPRLFVSHLEEAIKTGRAATSKTGIHNLDEGEAGLMLEDVQQFMTTRIGETQTAIAKARQGRAFRDFLNSNVVPWGYIPRYSQDFIQKIINQQTKLSANLAINNLNPNGVIVEDKFIEPTWEAPLDGFRQVIFISEGGRREALHLTNDVADQYEGFRFDSPEWVKWTIEAGSTLSMSKILKATATGYNPEFLVRNIPLDILHIQMTTNLYGHTISLGLLKMFRDMLLPVNGHAPVIAQVFRRSGAVQEYYRTGGYNSTLTHEGKWDQTSKNWTTRSKAMELFGDFMGYLGQSSELLTRVTMRETYIKNKLKEAAKANRVLSAQERKELEYEATEYTLGYLDFSQGGALMKELDKIFPYINAATQVTWGTLRAAKRDPITTLSKLTELAVFSILIGAWNLGLYAPYVKWMHDDDDDEERNKRLAERTKFYLDHINPRIKATNWIIMTNMTYMTETGKRYLYFKIPKDVSIQMPTGWIEGAFMGSATGDVSMVYNEQRQKELLSSLNMFGDMSFKPPIIKAITNYTSNRDAFFDEQIWKGKEVQPWAEYQVGRTPNMYVELGKLGTTTNEKGEVEGGLSPMRLNNAINQIIAKNNTFYAAFEKVMNLTIGDNVLPVKTQDQYYESLTKQFFIRRIIGATDYSLDRSIIEDFNLNANTSIQMVDNEIALFQQKLDDGEMNEKDIPAFVEEVATKLVPETLPDYQRALNKAQFDRIKRKAIRRALNNDNQDRYDYKLYLAMYYDDIPRADYLYYLMQHAANEKERTYYLETAKQINGFITDKVKNRLAFLDGKLGTKYTQ